MTTITLRDGLASEWTSANPTLAQSEFAVESDTGKFKVGDGTSNWDSLPYFIDENLVEALIDAAVAAGGGGGGGIFIGDADDIPDGTGKVIMTVAERTKLTGVAPSATANALDSALRDRTTHTGFQTSSTISDITEVIQDTVSSMVVAGAGVTWAYDDTLGKLTLVASGGDAETMRDTIGAALIGVGGVQITINDPGDTISFTLSGVPIASIALLQETLDTKSNVGHTHILADLDDIYESKIPWLEIVPSAVDPNTLDPDGTAKNRTMWFGVSTRTPEATDLGHGISASGTSHVMTPSGSRDVETAGLLLVAYVNVASGQTAPTIASVSGRGLTWGLKSPTGGDLVASSNGMVREYVYVGTGTDTGGNVTVTTTGGTTSGAARVGWRLVDLVAVDPNPAEYRSYTSSTGSAQAVAMTPDGDNVFVGAIWVNSSTDSPAPVTGSGLSDLGTDDNGTGPSQSVAGSTAIAVPAAAGWTLTSTNQVRLALGLSFTPAA